MVRSAHEDRIVVKESLYYLDVAANLLVELLNNIVSENISLVFIKEAAKEKFQMVVRLKRWLNMSIRHLKKFLKAYNKTHFYICTF